MKLQFYVALIFFAIPALGEESIVQSEKYHSVSFIKLIAHPDYYDGKLVVLSGHYLAHGDEPRVYMDQYSIENYIEENSFPINDPGFPVLREISGSLINIVGIFELRDKYSDPAGSLIEIKSVVQAGDLIWESKPNEK